MGSSLGLESGLGSGRGLRVDWAAAEVRRAKVKKVARKGRSPGAAWVWLSA